MRISRILAIATVVTALGAFVAPWAAVCVEDCWNWGLFLPAYPLDWHSVEFLPQVLCMAGVVMVLAAALLSLLANWRLLSLSLGAAGVFSTGFGVVGLFWAQGYFDRAATGPGPTFPLGFSVGWGVWVGLSAALLMLATMLSARRGPART